MAIDVGSRRQSWPLMLVVGDSHGHLCLWW